MTAVPVPGRWVDDPDFGLTHGVGDEGFCPCGAALTPTRYWVHADDEAAGTVGLATGWCCPECCDRRWEP